MNFYNKHILPRFLDLAMKREEMNKQRPEIVREASGIVLEIGFGSGLNIPYYKNITKLYALDPSRKLYELAVERIKNATFPTEYLEASAEKIPLADNTVDSIVSTWSLCTIPHPEIALREVFRVLKPHGKFVFIEHGKSPNNLISKLQRLLSPISKCLAGGCHMDREIDILIIESGLDLKKLEKFSQLYRPLAFMYKGVAISNR